MYETIIEEDKSVLVQRVCVCLCVCVRYRETEGVSNKGRIQFLKCVCLQVFDYSRLGV